MKNLTVVIVTGNLKFINHKKAKNYYKEMEAYLKEKGVDKVIFDPGEDFTCHLRPI